MFLFLVSNKFQNGIKIFRAQYDEFDWAPLLNPPLTVLNENSEEIGRQAAEMLIRLINQEGKGEIETQLKVPAELVIRQSCGCRKAHNT